MDNFYEGYELKDSNNNSVKNKHKNKNNNDKTNTVEESSNLINNNDINSVEIRNGENSRGTNFLTMLNENYSDNKFVKILIESLFFIPIFSLLLHANRNKINNIISSRELRKFGNIMIIMLVLIILYIQLFLNNENEGFMKIFLLFTAFIYLITHLCLYNDSICLKGFLEAKNSKH